MERFVSNVKRFTENLLNKQQTSYDETIEQLFSEISGLEDSHQILDPQLEECAIQLWNWAVTKHVGTSINKNQKAKVRHVACSLLYCCEPESPAEGILRKQILMASKTGRTWLDCMKPQIADNFFRLAVQSLETLYSRLTSRGDGTFDINTCKGDVEKDLLRIISYQAESAISQGNNHDAVALMQRCKDMLLRLPKETGYLSLLCYNFGVDAYNLRKFEDSSFWLREMDAFDYLKCVCQRFESSPELGTALVLHIELLLQRGKELLGKQKIEDIITGHYTGKQLTPQALTSLHLMLWDKASKHFEAKNYSEALQWYNYSLSFYKAGQMEPNLAKLQRNRASCLLQLQQLEKAKEAIKEAERCDPDSIFTQFSVYKIAVLENNVEKAAEAVNTMGLLAKKSPVSNEDKLLVSENAASNLLSLAAQIALENGQQDAAMKALESLCENSKDEAQVVTALRCLVRLVLSAIDKASDDMRNANLDVLLSYLKIALQKVSYRSPEPCMAVEQRAEEANWFRKIAWNSALQCESSPDRMRDFFVLSYKFSQLCPPDRTVLMCQKTCLLMAAAASLEVCRKSPGSSQTEELTQALEHIQICWEVWKTLKASGSFPMDPTDTLLLLYEFEARAKLNDSKVETVLESVLELENVEVKVLETIAALAMEPPAHFPVLCKKALRIVLSLHKKQPQADLSRCSQYVHSLIQLSLPSGVSEVEARVLEEVWGYYEEALSIIAAAPDDFPEMETLWLLTRAWNTGILLYSLAQYPEAEKWCGLGMSFLRHLGSLQESYQTQMSGLYSEVLDRLNRAKRNQIMEE
ncbi:testis-expressed protein 11 isoform X3 [Myripristis murdjan]|uniref:testis-expressed protein 11 isoform X3 n=1 Tax=Myripristis murdjan TaxID=586833 RepID=UPI0011762EE8|nr:testis-expressed protein 11 isoform X3 [Myripristis murdjan]